MTHMTITIDATTILDGDLGQWQHQPPDTLTQYLKPNTKPKPWAPALMAAIIEAVTTNTPTTVNIHTDPHGWTVTVTHPPKAQAPALAVAGIHTTETPNSTTQPPTTPGIPEIPTEPGDPQ